MKELHSMCMDAGCNHCVTYVQSGNICAIHASQDDLINRLSVLLAEKFSAPVAIFGYTPHQWLDLIEHLPFAQDPMPYVSFLTSPLTETQHSQINDYLCAEESIASYRNFLYYAGKTPSTSKFSNTLVERITGQSATTRNWNTVVALQEIAQTMFC